MGVQYVTTRPAEQKQSVVGIVALLMGAIIFVVMVAAAAFGGQAYSLAAKTLGHTSTIYTDPAAEPYGTRTGVCSLIMIVMWALSFVPFVLGIIGARRPPRNMGITALALAVLTPIVGLVVMVAFMVPGLRYPN